MAVRFGKNFPIKLFAIGSVRAREKLGQQFERDILCVILCATVYRLSQRNTGIIFALQSIQFIAIECENQFNCLLA